MRKSAPVSADLAHTIAEFLAFWDVKGTVPLLSGKIQVGAV
jgi:hypothetical protein